MSAANLALTGACYIASMSATPNTVQIERRKSKRSRIGHHVLRIEAENGGEPISCVVWDMSETGARLVLGADVVLPAEVNVLIGNVTHRARVVWSKERYVGLEFLDQLSDL